MCSNHEKVQRQDGAREPRVRPRRAIGWRRCVCAIALGGAIFLAACATSSVSTHRSTAPVVMGWIPTVGIQSSLAALKSNPAIGQALTRIGLQFWIPSPDGTRAVLAPVDAAGTLVTAADIATIRDWAHARHIKVLLTVYNNSETTKVWNWQLALRAFRDHRAAFVASLVAQMDKYKLDGIDVDLEGDGAFDADRAAYAAFVKALSKAIHAQGKLLTIDTFHSPCYNAPNMSWWRDWRGEVDTLNIMGYQDLYEASTATFQPKGQPVCENGAHIFKYSWQLAYAMRAGYQPYQVAMGLPTWVDQWGAPGDPTSAASHIREVQALGAGIAMWDLELPTPGWRSTATWQAALALREHPGNGWKTLLSSKTAGLPKPARSRSAVSD